MARSLPSIMSLRAVTSAGPSSSEKPYRRVLTRLYGQHPHRQQHGVVADEVGLALGAEPVDQFVGEPFGMAPQHVRVDGLQRVADHGGALAVPLADRVEDRRLLAADHRQQRPVGGDVLPLVPQVGVPAEQHRVAGHLVQFPVAEHQPRGDVPVEQHRGDGTVLAPHLPVQQGGFGLEAGAAERYGVGGVGAHANSCRGWAA
jgi:hypothetical protein